MDDSFEHCPPAILSKMSITSTWTTTISCRSLPIYGSIDGVPHEHRLGCEKVDAMAHVFWRHFDTIFFPVYSINDDNDDFSTKKQSGLLNK